eukprot:Gb_36978 [translate_table: standard]
MMNPEMVLGLLLFAVTASLFTPGESLIPFTGRYSNLWDSLIPSDLVDPFRVLEQIPVSVPKDVEAVALARVDWKETPETHVFTIDVPGMNKEEIKIEVEENRVLRISGERRKEEEKETDKWHRVERSTGKFWRQFRLPANVNLDAVKANLENGVLIVTVPKVSDEMKRDAKIVDIIENSSEKGQEIGGKAVQ